MSSITLNGARVTSGSIALPHYGAWTADIVIAGLDTIDDAVTLVVGDLTLKGTVIRQAPFGGSKMLRIVGGSAGWREVIPTKGYSHVVGVKLSTVLKDAARSAGETIEIDTDRVLGTSYAREEAKAERVLALLTAGAWWIDPDGVTQLKARPATAVTAPFTVVAHLGGKGQFEIATEAISQWQPGRTFTGPTLSDTYTISSVSIEASNEGKVRLLVLSAGTGATERMLTSLRAIIRAEVSQLSYAGVWEYEVVPDPLSPGLSSAIDVKPKDPRMPALSKVPLAPELGVVATPAAGTDCRIRFLNCDPAKPECIALGATTEHLMTTEACSLLIYNTLVAWCAAAGGGPLLAAVLQPLIMPAILAALAAQSAPAPPGLIAQTAAATPLAATMAAGTTPSPTSLPFNTAIAALSTKTLDLSGAFPGVGVPSQ